MIIVINDLPEIVNDGDKIKALNNILMAFGEGKHVLWIPSKKISEIIESEIVVGYNLQVLHELKDQSRLMRSILDSFDFFVDVDFSSDKSPGFVSPNRLVISYTHFVDSASVQLPVFVAENLSDIEFYIFGSKVYLRNNKLLSSHDVKFRHVSGGGNTTVESFEYSLRAKEMVLCILDSDKNHPSAGLKDTAARFSAYPQGWGLIYWLHILDCTEAENLVPWKVAEAVLSENQNFNLETFLILTEDTRRYIDHKKGFRFYDALAADALHGSDFWSARLSRDVDPQAWICEPMGSRFLEKCIELMRGISIHKLSEMVDGRDKSYMILSRMIASWGVSPKSAIR
ncbi:hypothetical protein [Pseudomonas chlororaphis]|uniref:hypothetical protein n=1 Tax=Pseudomonas chlororaphis TaxID=587753 RepID=UPI00240778DB|nr:hypothetical protein [Pseudomonas chlororaphis]